MTSGDKCRKVDTPYASNSRAPRSKALITVPVARGCMPAPSSKALIPVPVAGGCMEVDTPDASNSPVPPSKTLIPVPVVGGSSGEGLPYAPEDFPRPGDIWKWKVGNRRSVSGFWGDRYLYPPCSCPKASGIRSGFPSRLSVEEYLRKEFPDTNVDDFFSSFIWKIPSSGGGRIKGSVSEKNLYSFRARKNLDDNGCSGTESAIKDGECKAGNKRCTFQANALTSRLAAKACEICCSEAGFCRDCCCILCCRTIDWAYEGYSYIRCEATLDKNYICGHVAHIDCALRSCMAGTVGGSIGLDAEYYCRRCDNKTDLIPHAAKLIKTCTSLDFQGDIGKILNLGLCFLRGSEQTRAKNLQNQIELIMAKLKGGVCRVEIWKGADSISAGDTFDPGNEIKVLGAPGITRSKTPSNHTNDLRPSQDCRSYQGPVYITSDHSNVSVKLEDEVNQALRELKKSQESEYRTAEQKLCAQKDFLLSLYQQLDAERSKLASPASSSNVENYDALLSNVLRRVDQIKQEEVRLRSMTKIGKGFGRAQRSVLAEHFGLADDE